MHIFTDKTTVENTCIFRQIKLSQAAQDMEIETKMGTCREESSTTEEPLSLSPAARLFHSPHLNCYIVIRIGFKTRIKPDVFKAGVKENLPKHPRFASKMVDKGGKKKWITVSVNMEDHVIVPNLDSNMEHPDKFVDDYISNLTTAPLDLSKPLWEIHILNVKTSEAEAIAVNRLHHSLGDGASLLSLLLACTRQTSNPDALPSLPKKKRADSSNNSCWFCWFFLMIWSAIRLLGNTVVDTVVFMATILFLKDTKTPMKGAPGVEHTTKRFLHRTVSLDHIKEVKNAMNMTVNDVVLAVTQAGLSRYLNGRYDQYQKNEQKAKQKINNLLKSIRLTANVMVNLRATVEIQALAEMMTKESKTKWGWGNSIGFIFIPFTIALQHDPLDYVRRAKALIDRKKHSLGAVVTFLTAKLFVKILGSKRTGAIACRAVSNTTLTFSSLVGPLEEISFYGHPIAYIAPSVYGHPHALYVHFQSYADKMMISIAVDPDAIPDPNQLLDDLEESLKLIRDAVVKKGLTNEAV